MMKKRTFALLVAGWATFLACTAPAQTPLKDPRGRVQAAMQNAAELKSLGFTESVKGTMAANGGTNDSALKGELVLRGKTGLSSLFTMQKQQIRVVSDGTTHCLYIIGDRTYQKTGEAIPRTQLMTVVTRGILNTATTWVAGFLHNKTELLDTSGNIEGKGDQNIEGTDCEGYLLSYSGFDVTAWLTHGDPPVLRRAEVDLDKSAKSQGKDSGVSSALVQVDITDWKPNVDTQDSQFVFTPPDGVEELKPGADVLEGKKAVDFDLPLLGGGSVKLSGLRGKSVVLDFWATWCGPCRKAMPIVDKVTEEFADRGVVLYTINQGEEPEKIEKFLAAMQLNPKVALDTEGKASRAYQANSIPRIVLIDTDGVVRKVFRGVPPQFEDALREACTALVKTTAPAK